MAAQRGPKGPRKMPGGEDVIGVAQAAQLRGVKMWQVHEWIWSGLLKARKIGNAYALSRRQVEALVVPAGWKRDRVHMQKRSK